MSDIGSDSLQYMIKTQSNSTAKQPPPSCLILASRIFKRYTDKEDGWDEFHVLWFNGLTGMFSTPRTTMHKWDEKGRFDARFDARCGTGCTYSNIAYSSGCLRTRMGQVNEFIDTYTAHATVHNVHVFRSMGNSTQVYSRWIAAWGTQPWQGWRKQLGCPK